MGPIQSVQQRTVRSVGVTSWMNLNLHAPRTKLKLKTIDPSNKKNHTDHRANETDLSRQWRFWVIALNKKRMKWNRVNVERKNAKTRLNIDSELGHRDAITCRILISWTQPSPRLLNRSRLYRKLYMILEDAYCELEGHSAESHSQSNFQAHQDFES